MSETQRVFRNTAAHSAPVVTTFVFSFILAPVMLSQLGLAQFGVWAVTGALAQYAKLLDFGVTSSLSRFVALYDARGERWAIEETIGVGMFVATILGALVLTAAFFAAPLASEILGVLDPAQMRVVLISSAGIATSYMFVAVLSAIPFGLRRMGPPNAAATAGNVVNFTASIVVLAFSTELTTYALANLGAAIVALLMTAASLYWVWSGRMLRRPPLARAREIASFGIRSQFVTLAQLVNVQTDKVIIAVMLGPRIAGAYEIGNRIVQGVLSLGLLSLSTLIPTATADLVQRGKAVIREYFQRYTVRSLALALPLFGSVCVSAPYLLVAWLGEMPADTVAVIVLLSVSFAVSMATGVAMTLMMSDGRPGVVAQTAAMVVGINITATIVAAPLFGLWGVLLATVGAEIVAAAVFLWRFHRRYELDAAEFRAAVSSPVMVSLGAAAPFAVWYLSGAAIPDERAPAAVGFLLTGGLYGLACWVVESRLQLLPEKLRLGWIRATIGNYISRG